MVQEVMKVEGYLRVGRVKVLANVSFRRGETRGLVASLPRSLHTIAAAMDHSWRSRWPGLPSR